MHMPPPVHGAAIVGQQVHDSYLINNAFDCRYVNVATARSLDDIGRTGIRKLIDNIRKWREMYHVVRDFHPDLVYITPNTTRGAFYRDFITVQLLKYLQSNMVLHLHNKGVSKRQDRWLDDKLYRRFFRGVKVILLSQRLYADIEKYVAREDVLICPNGIVDTNITDNSKYDNFRQDNTVPIQLLFLSNMMADKGVWTLLDALRIVKDHGVPFFCHFVGGWKDVNEHDFVKCVDAYGLSTSVLAHGAKYGEEKNTFLYNADVLVFPTKEECFPLVLLEAMSQAKACIASIEASIPEIVIDEETGLLVEKDNPIALAQAIECMAQDHNLCHKMGEAGRKRFEQLYTLEHFEQRMLQILNDCSK